MSTFANYFSNLKKLPVNVRVLCVTGLIEGFIAIGPIWALYVDELHGSIAALGGMLALSSICMSIFQVPGGLYSDWYGRRNAIIIGEVIRILTLVFAGCALSWEWLIPALLFSSIASALIGPAKSALIAESVESTRRGRSYAVVDTVQAIAMILGPAIGLWVAGRASIRIVFFSSAVLALLSLLITIQYLEEKRHFPRPQKERRKWMGGLREQLSFTRNIHLNILLLSQGIAMIAASFAAPFFTLFAVKDVGVSKEKLAVVFMVTNILLMITRIPMGHLADRPSVLRKYLLVWGCVWGGIVWTLVSFCTNYDQLFVYALLSFAFVLPARSALLADMTLPEERAKVFGTLSAVDGISGAIGYSAAGIFAQAYGLRSSMSVAGVGLLMAGLFITLFFKEKRRA